MGFLYPIVGYVRNIRTCHARARDHPCTPPCPRARHTTRREHVTSLASQQSQASMRTSTCADPTRPAFEITAPTALLLSRVRSTLQRPATLPMCSGCQLSYGQTERPIEQRCVPAQHYYQHADGYATVTTPSGITAQGKRTKNNAVRRATHWACPKPHDGAEANSPHT